MSAHSHWGRKTNKPNVDVVESPSSIIDHPIVSSRRQQHRRIALLSSIAGSVLSSIIIILSFEINASQAAAASGRMVRLCIASVDPAKLSSQCVMCNRRDFPLTVIDCTGITKVNDLIANPLSVREATCLIYNCRRQVPDVKPEPYHGSVSQAVNYRGAAASNYPPPIAASGSQLYEMMPPSGFLGGGYSMLSPTALFPPATTSVSPYMSRFGLGYRDPIRGSASLPSLSSMLPRGLIGGGAASLGLNRNQPLQYTLVPAPNNYPFG